MIFGWALLGVLFLILGSVCPDEGWAGVTVAAVALGGYGLVEWVDR